jgi:predicted enzyme related to lactoylglutathione lyase
MTSVNVRYVVKSVEVAIRFYCQRFGFTEVMFPLRSLAILERGDLQLTLVTAALGQPGPSAAHGEQPGGWNRFQLNVDDLEAEVRRLVEKGVAFRGEPVDTVGGKYVIAEDPSGNPIELFQQEATS